MLFMQSRTGRKFVGRLSPGEDLIPALKEICLDNNIESGEFRATGFLRDVVLEVFHHGEGRYRPLVLGHVAYQLTSCTGNVSLLERDMALHIHATLLPDLATGENRLVGGRILQATVIALEFILDTIDDFALVRRLDPETGLAQWVELDLHDQPAPHSNMATQAELAGHPTADRAPHPPRGHAVADPDDDADLEQTVELVPGDILDHPRFRLCEVLSFDGERAMIRMDTGRTAELHMGVFSLTEEQPNPDGSRLFTVRLRRR